MMGWMARAWRGALDALLRLPLFGSRADYQVEVVEDLPDRLGRNTLYVVAEGGNALHASMACPRRRCATVLNMNLAPDESPRWFLTVNVKGVPTLAPSVWRRTDCGCHFFLREGRIDWCD